jgi:lipopolysaccharide/colanic/teichoic acid biosynthesis glycosyltransferase
MRAELRGRSPVERGFDLLAATATFLLLSTLMMPVAILIKMESPARRAAVRV